MSARRPAMLVTFLAVVVAGCGDAGPSVQVGQAASTTTTASAGPGTTTSSTLPGATTTTSTSVPAATTTTTTLPGTRTVTYRTVQLTVPAAWPVHDLAAEPRRCVRHDANAVFLGTQGSDPSCPARVVGRTQTVHVQPLSGNTKLAEALATSVVTINGLLVRVDPSADTSGSLVAVLADRELLVTVTFGSDRAGAHQILASLRAS